MLGCVIHCYFGSCSKRNKNLNDENVPLKALRSIKHTEEMKSYNSSCIHSENKSICSELPAGALKFISIWDYTAKTLDHLSFKKHERLYVYPL